MKNLGFFRYFAYALFVILLYILQATPGLMPELFGSKPLLLIPLALAVASVEGEIPSLVFGAVCGGLTDIASGGSVGYFAVALTLICCFEAGVFSRLFVPGFLTASVYAFLAILVSVGVYFLIFKALSGVPDWGVLFVNHYISRIAYTMLAFLPICAVTRFIGGSFK